jgi:hypothetical protein
LVGLAFMLALFSMIACGFKGKWPFTTAARRPALIRFHVLFRSFAFRLFTKGQMSR